MCDGGLAGSERQKASESEGERLREATSINRSLSTLGLVIKKLVAGEAHIPYRDSRLTFLMQVSFVYYCKSPLLRDRFSPMNCTASAGPPRLFVAVPA